MKIRVSGLRNFPYRVVNIRLLYSCNLTCSYCNTIRKQPKTLPENLAIRFINEICQHTSKQTFPVLTGGECTLHPKFINICENIQIPFGVHTNLMYDNSIFEKLLNITNFHMLLTSIHFETSDLNILKKRIDKAIESNKYVRVMCMLENNVPQETILKTLQYYTELFDNYKYGSIEPRVIIDYDITDTDNSDYYSNEQLLEPYKQYVSDASKFIINGNCQSELDYIFNPVSLHGSSCDILSYFCNVNPNGKIELCRVTVGDIRTCNTKVFEQKIICPQPVCDRCLLRFGEKESN